MAELGGGSQPPVPGLVAGRGSVPPQGTESILRQRDGSVGEKQLPLCSPGMNLPSERPTSCTAEVLLLLPVPPALTV